MSRPTRGFGALEQFLARQRARVADRLIPPSPRGGRLLDIGCGSAPVFLTNTEFSEKYGLEKVAPGIPQDCAGHGMTILPCDIEKGSRLPFEDAYFDVVALLAVLEHIRPPNSVGVLREVRRILKTGGICVLTTPAPWTGRLLRFMARLRLVSPEEIREHQALYGGSGVASLLQEAGFSKERVRWGAFEFFMNGWITATK